jgi:hypothetical protein
MFPGNLDHLSACIQGSVPEIPMISIENMCSLSRTFGTILHVSWSSVPKYLINTGESIQASR